MIDSSIAVQVQDLRKSFSGGLFARNVDALRGVTFDVPRGQIFGLLGPNGAGKTTIIKILLGIVRASGGKAMLLGHPAGDRYGRRNVGYLPENLLIPRHQNALMALEYYGRLSGMDYSDIKRRGAELLEKVGLQARKKESVKQFSKGMRQRLGLAQALLHDPELLILDEPTDGLDPVGRSQVRDIMRELSDEGRTVFVNSHLLQEVELICNHVAILNKGELKYSGSIDDFTSNAASSELQLEVVAGVDALHGYLAQFKVTNLVGLSQDRVQVSINVADQNEINAIVDTLRQHGVGIVSLVRSKRTLEDLFLDVVSKTGYQA